MTDPTGSVFISYRRSRHEECDRLVASLRERGIPTWRDIDDMNTEPTENELRRILGDDRTAGAILWITPETAESGMIRMVEAPGAVARHSRGDGFFIVPVAAGGLDYSDAALAVGNGVGLADISGWNTIKLESDPADDADIAKVVNRVLRQRLESIDRHWIPDEPIRLALNTRQAVNHQPGTGLTIDWSHRFGGLQNRVASAVDWQDKLLPALSAVRDAIQETVPGRGLVAGGLPSLSAATALGYCFMATGGPQIAWEQRMPNQSNQNWSLAADVEESGFEVRTSAGQLDAHNLAVMVSVNNDVSDAVTASSATTGPFRAYAHIKRADSVQSAILKSPGQALDVARKVVAEARNARQKYHIAGQVHLFAAAPAGLAMLIGQLLNTLGPVQTYEHIPYHATGSYEPAVLLCNE